MRAMTLLLFLLIWRITSESQGESCQTSILALEGALPAVMPRAIVPPSSCQSRLNKPSK
ncbi:hypothetical protein CDEF62S_02388 [Castellaniella defragrans]